MGIIWSNLRREPLFQVGLVIKVIFIITLLPKIQQDWFLPFIINWFENPFNLPWTSFLLSDGDILSFPYGPIMFVSYLPTTLLGWIIDLVVGGNYFTYLGFRISLLIGDFLLLLILLNTFDKEWRGILLYYWLSPLVLFITYWHGQTDLIPIALFVYSLTQIKKKNFRVASIFIAFSVMAKHSMLISIPFIFIYLLKQRVPLSVLKNFTIFFLGTFFIIEAPLFLSESFQIMVLGTPEVEKIYWMTIQMGKDNLIYLTILVYLLLLYFFFRIRRINFDLLLAAMGVAFSIIILMTPSSPGWYLWVVPMLMLHQSRYGNRAVMLVGGFSIFFIFYHLIYSSGASVIFMKDIDFQIDKISNLKYRSIHYTLVIGFGILIAIQMLREGVRSNDYYQLGQRPLALGIAGDSGTGKSTFSSGIANLFGERSSIEISGDDYHNWDRGSPMWNMHTHLDPRSNRLFDMIRDVRSLINGNAVYARTYNHLTGRFLPPQIRKSSDVILVTGLHALFSKQLREELDVRIFMRMDEKLQVSLRMRRDVEERGRNKNAVQEMITKRKPDYNRFIEPQAECADVIFNLIPVNPDLIDKITDKKKDESNLKLRIFIRNGIYYHELVRILIGVCGLHVNIESIDEKGEVVIEVNGDVSSEDAKLAAHVLLPHMDELLGYETEFSKGTLGLMQIITLMEIDEALKRRKKN